MLDCLILGDSIAVGLAPVMHCHTIAQVGISSTNFTRAHITVPRAGLTVISLGSNDDGACECLRTLRKGIQGRVVWVLPLNNSRARSLITSIASSHHDTVVDIPSSADGVHPRSYRQLAKRVMSKHR